MNSILLCTFSHTSDINISIDYIFQNYTLERDCIFVFENVKKTTDLYCTYNVESIDRFIENTIMIHRKKESNTLYTINALNEIIIRANNGILDKRFIIDWSIYTNSILLLVDGNVKSIPLKLKTVSYRKK